MCKPIQLYINIKKILWYFLQMLFKMHVISFQNVLNSIWFNLISCIVSITVIHCYKQNQYKKAIVFVVRVIYNEMNFSSAFWCVCVYTDGRERSENMCVHVSCCLIYFIFAWNEIVIVMNDWGETFLRETAPLNVHFPVDQIKL